MKIENIQQGNCNSAADKLRLIADALERGDSEVAILNFDLGVRSNLTGSSGLWGEIDSPTCASFEVNIEFGLKSQAAGELTAKLMQG